jgi:hypothetical protein
MKCSSGQPQHDRPVPRLQKCHFGRLINDSGFWGHFPSAPRDYMSSQRYLREWHSQCQTINELGRPSGRHNDLTPSGHSLHRVK